MKIINVDGGIGRVITSLPSLLKYHKNNPEEEWYLQFQDGIISTFGIPELDERTFNPETKGVWENYYLKMDEIVNPEPYRLPISTRERFLLQKHLMKSLMKPMITVIWNMKL